MMTFLCPINPSVVFEKLTSLKCGKTPGPDGWPVEVFKKCACTPLVYTFYKIIGEWYSATRLENWSYNAHIQKGQKNKVNNHRPVCLTYIVIKYLYDNNLLSPKPKWICS